MAQITEDYVSFEVAKLLKKKGFNEPTTGFYPIVGKAKESFHKGALYRWNYFSDRGIAAPTIQMAMKWLREEKGIAVIPIISSVLDFEKFLWDVKIVVAKTGDSYSQGWVYEKQENACETAIRYCLENLI